MSSEIRTVDELESLRVTLSEEIEQLEKTGTTVAELNKVKKLRTELANTKTELQIAKNLEKVKLKERLLAEVQSKVLEAREHYAHVLELASQGLPLLRELEPVIAQLALAAYRLSAANNHIDEQRRGYMDLYPGETLDVDKPPMVYQVIPAAVRGYIMVLQGMISPAGDKEGQAHIGNGLQIPSSCKLEVGK